MTKIQHATTRDLISKIEAKDRRFRTAWVIFMFIIALALCGVVLFQFRTNAKIDKQLTQLKVLAKTQQETIDAVKASGDQRTKQLQTVNDHIDCIASFFNFRNRAQSVITDLDQCKVESFDGTSTTLPTNKNAQPQPQQQPAQTQPQNGGQTPSNSQQPQNQGSDNQPQKPPVEILGVPVCVPFTSACVRE